LGKKVVVLGEVPQFPISPNLCLQHTVLGRVFRDEESYTHCGEADKKLLRKQYSYVPYLMVMAKKYGVEYFNPLPYLHHSITEEGVVLYKDDNHLNSFGASELIPHFNITP
jgi:hypothetical protein